MTNYRPIPDGTTAVDSEGDIRHQAAEALKNRPLVTTYSNGEERAYRDAPVSSFTKGLKQDVFGIVSKDVYQDWVDELATAPINGFLPATTNPDDLFFERLNPDASGATLPKAWRKYESPIGGLNSDMIGPAVAGLSLPPAPPLGSSELCAEMAEVYAMAILRDLPFHAIQVGTSQVQVGNDTITVNDVVEELNTLSWFDPTKEPVSFDADSDKPQALSPRERRRHSVHGRPLTPETLFRGATHGARHGPYLSQFMLQGTAGNAAGDILFGTQRISQKTQPDISGLNFMTNWAEWLDVQRGGARNRVSSDTPPHFLTTPRDLAAYVHIDQLYQAYFNAALMITGAAGTAAFDPGLPNADKAYREGFATWGGPHLLDMLARVSSPALRAVRRSKFQIHRRARPEVIAARITMAANGYYAELGKAAPRLRSMLTELQNTRLLGWVHALNEANEATSTLAQRGLSGSVPADVMLPEMQNNYLLPMAFPEGSPMHPAYGAGHATVAGACVTVLKAMLRTVEPDGTKTPMSLVRLTRAVAGDGDRLKEEQGHPLLAITDELDKLAANISIGRNLAGVHYYTDYYESLRLGERVAVAMLEEHLLTSPERTRMDLFDFDGRRVTIRSEVTSGTGNKVETYLDVKGVDGSDISREDWWIDGVA